MINEYTIERLTPDRFKDVNDLYFAVYKKRRAAEYWLKKYDTKWTGLENIGYVAYRDNIAIGFYAVIPCFIRYNGALLPAAQSADTMTHPVYIQKGLFVKLSEMTFALSRQNGIKIIFGFPNQNSYHGAVTRLGWRETEKMCSYVIPLEPSVITKMLNRVPGYSKKHLQEYIDNNKKGINNSLITQGLNGVERDDQFINYKTYSNTSVIKVSDWQFWVKAGNVFFIGDICKGNEPFNSILEQLKNIAKRSGASDLIFQLSPGSDLNQLLSLQYTSNPAYPVLFQVFDETIDIRTIKFTFADLDIF